MQRDELINKISPKVQKIALLYTCIFTCFFIISICTYPATGMWHLIDAEKLIAGAVLYSDVKTVIPPGFYLEFIPFALLGIKSLFFYRTVGVFLISLTFLIYYIVVRKYLNTQRALFLTFATLAVYISTPWEIYNSYSYIACILVLVSLSVHYSNRFLSYYLVGLAACFKITIGGAVIIGYLACHAFEHFVIKKKCFYKDTFKSLLMMVAGVLTPILFLKLLGIKLDLTQLLGLVFSGESKGGFYSSLTHPFRSFVSFWGWFNTITIPEGFYGFVILSKFFITLLGLSLILALWWLISLFTYLFATIRLIKNGEYDKFFHFLPLIVSLFGTTYASAMSSYIKSDDILLLSFLFLFQYVYLDKSYKKIYLMLLTIPIMLIYALLIFKCLPTLAVVFVLVCISIVWILVKKQNVRMFFFVFFICSIFLIKLLLGPLAWWETNIRGLYLRNFSSLGFFTTPFYNDLDNRLHFLKNHAKRMGIPLTVYSFPTSSLPYHIFDYLPPWKFTVHHADVFPKSEVLSEFEIINKVSPSFMVISRWNYVKINQLDNEYAPGSITSQHYLSSLIDQMLIDRYSLCSTITYKDGSDLYNHPVQIYVLKQYINEDQQFNYLCDLRKSNVVD